MKHLRRFNESKLIKATDDTIKRVVKGEIKKLGSKADLNHIDVSEVTNMDMLFIYSPFNGNISNWNVKNVVSMRQMFNGCSFGGDISNWNIENVEIMSFMFLGSYFGGNLDKWRPRSLKKFYQMFKNSPFNARDIYPIWYNFLKWGLFKSGEDYCHSLRYGWLVGNKIYVRRLKVSLDSDIKESKIRYWVNTKKLRMYKILE